MRGYYQDLKCVGGHFTVTTAHNYGNYIQVHTWAAYSARLSLISHCRKNGLRSFVGRIPFAGWGTWRAHFRVWTIVTFFALTSPRAIFTQMTFPITFKA